MSTSALSTLIEIAAKEVMVAAKNLGYTIRAKQAADKQLDLLIQYRSDYEMRFQDSAKRGLNITQYTNFQSFIGKLDLAIEGQKKLILDADYKISQARSEWQACEKKRLSFQTLINKKVMAAQKKEAKSDQKQTDERATRRFFYKK